MAEKIELFELDIDMDALIESSGKVEKNIIGLNSEIKDLKEEFKKGDISTKEYSKTFVQLNAQLKTNQAEQRKQTKLIQAYSDQQNKAIQIIKQTDGSINQLGAALAKNRDLYRNLSKEQRENSDIGQELLKVISEQDKEYKDLQKSIGTTQVEVGNYKEQMKEALQEQDAFGFSVNGIKEKFAAFLNPVTAGIAAITALGKLYTSSVNGARDLERAQNQLSIAMGRFNNSLARAVGTGEDGEGLLSKFVNAFNTKVFGLANAAIARIGADAAFELQKLEVAEFEAQKLAKEQLRTAEELRQIRDEERNSIEDRKKANEELLQVIAKREADAIAFQEKRLTQAKILNASEENSFETQQLVKQIEFEIADIREEAAGFRSEALANELAIFREVNEQQRELSIARIEEELINVEEGSERELQLLLQKNEAIKRANIEAAGENATLRATAIQQAENEEQRIIKQFQAEREAKRMAEEEQELGRIRDFEARKRELKNQIELENAVTEEEKEQLKIQQEFEKQVLELEKLQLDEQQKTELLILLEEQRGMAIEEVREKLNEDALKKQKEFNEKNLAQAEAAAQAEADIQRELVGILTGILGDSLGAQLASIALEALIKTGQVKATAAAASAQNLAQATATAPPPFNIPFISAALAQNAVLKASAAKNIAQITAAAAISGTKAVVSKVSQDARGYASGGRVGDKDYRIPTQPNGDNVLATLKTGEVVLNESQQRALGGHHTFASIGVPGFATGGVVGGGVTNISNNNINIQQLAQELAKANAALPNPVVIVEDINTGQDRVASVESSANF